MKEGNAACSCELSLAGSCGVRNTLSDFVEPLLQINRFSSTRDQVSHHILEVLEQNTRFRVSIGHSHRGVQSTLETSEVDITSTLTLYCTNKSDLHMSKPTLQNSTFVFVVFYNLIIDEVITRDDLYRDGHCYLCLGEK